MSISIRELLNPTEKRESRLANVEQKLAVCDFLSWSIRELMPGVQPIMPEGWLEYVRKPINPARPFKHRDIVKGWKALTRPDGTMYAAFMNHGDINLGRAVQTNELGGFVTLKYVEQPTPLSPKLVEDMSNGIGVKALERSLHLQFESRIQAAREKRQAEHDQVVIAPQIIQPLSEYPFSIAA